jgi:hypothetical protein
MSKNSAQQTYEASKAFAQMAENKRKRATIRPKMKAKPKKYSADFEE